MSTIARTHSRNGASSAPDEATRELAKARSGIRGLDEITAGGLVKGLVHLHHGDVEGHSAGPGQGAEFIVRLPLDVSDGSHAVTPPARAPQRPWRILVIEDNVDSAETLKMLLESRGHEVEVAYAGAEGLETARSWRPEVVLCDIGLPGMDGYEVARALRRDDLLHDAFLIALSGYAMPEDVRRASDAGFDHHLAKPLRMEKLDQVLAILEPRRSPVPQDHGSDPRCS